LKKDFSGSSEYYYFQYFPHFNCFYLASYLILFLIGFFGTGERFDPEIGRFQVISEKFIFDFERIYWFHINENLIL
jgi:hypothetical protein